MYQHIDIAEDDGIVTITLNRPERLNAFVGHMRRDLAEALEEAGSDPHVRVVIITGEGRAFCAGGDVQFMCELVEREDAEEFARILGAARRVILAIRQMTKPVIASIEVPASGAGFNLALSCDLRLGLINRVVAPEELEAETQKLAERLRSGPAVSIAAAKHAVYASEHDTLEQMLQYEVEAQVRCFESEDGREGVRAFIEKRPPRFTGR